ncbi:MAG: hypothetical protein WC979_01710 [Candidatus Pacearchaeota archaeon]|jgi:hypothetical protein|nr:hypothetical protein [Clostridia bacterium]
MKHININGFLGLDEYLKTQLNETNLGAQELGKINSKTGELRTEILKRKIMNHEPIELVKGGFFTVTDTDDAINKINNLDLTHPLSFNLKGEIKGKSTTISTSQFLKTAEFGSGGGKRGGADNTDLNESAQCYYCSAVCNILNSESDESAFTPDVLKKAAQYVQASTSVDDVISKIEDDWITSSVVIANELFNKGIISKGMIFHRGSAIFKKIYELAKTAGTNSEISFNSDKWNPADIFGILPSVIVADLNTTSLPALNEEILELFNKRQFVPISLKKTEGKPKVEIFNGGSEKPNFHPITYTVSDGKKSTFESNMKVFMSFNGGKSEGRTFNAFSNWALEIQGKYAAGGKCGLTPILGIMNYNGVTPPILNYTEIKKNSMKPDANFIDDMFLLYNEFDNSHSYDINTFGDFVKGKASNPSEQGWIFSKYLGMKVLSAIKNSNKENDIINDIVLYAASQSSFSSVFAKVY